VCKNGWTDLNDRNIVLQGVASCVKILVALIF